MAGMANCVVAGLIISCGCSVPESTGGPSPAHPASETANEPTRAQALGPVGPVIGTLELRDDALVITASGRGPLFTVRDTSGRVVAQGLSREQLRERFGDLHRAYETGVARHGSAPFLDARKDHGGPDQVGRRPEGRR